MHLPNFIRKPLVRYIRRRLAGEAPDQLITNGDPGSILIERYNLFPWLRIFGVHVRAHEIVCSDRGRHVHDHPWWSVSVLLEGYYYEMHPVGDLAEGKSLDLRVTMREEGEIIIRGAAQAHRIVLPCSWGSYLQPDLPCLSMFIHGPAIRRWGYWSDDGHWSAAK